MKPSKPYGWHIYELIYWADFGKFHRINENQIFNEVRLCSILESSRETKPVYIYMRNWNNYEKLAHTITEVEKSHDPPSACWRPRKASDVI